MVGNQSKSQKTTWKKTTEGINLMDAMGRSKQGKYKGSETIEGEERGKKEGINLMDAMGRSKQGKDKGSETIEGEKRRKKERRKQNGCQACYARATWLNLFYLVLVCVLGHNPSLNGAPSKSPFWSAHEEQTHRSLRNPRTTGVKPGCIASSWDRTPDLPKEANVDTHLIWKVITILTLNSQVVHAFFGRFEFDFFEKNNGFGDIGLRQKTAKQKSFAEVKTSAGGQTWIKVCGREDVFRRRFSPFSSFHPFPAVASLPSISSNDDQFTPLPVPSRASISSNDYQFACHYRCHLPDAAAISSMPIEAPRQTIEQEREKMSFVNNVFTFACFYEVYAIVFLQMLKKQTVFFVQTADVWTTSSSAELCRCGPQTADVLTLKKQTAPKSLVSSLCIETKSFGKQKVFIFLENFGKLKQPNAFSIFPFFFENFSNTKRTLRRSDKDYRPFFAGGIVIITVASLE
ncbi:hypothetical protein LXL04_031857 [Taraxacum kok-saghyz]